jgi:predicted PhzF superfamily epimerase YddE/YHI9
MLDCVLFVMQLHAESVTIVRACLRDSGGGGPSAALSGGGGGSPTAVLPDDDVLGEAERRRVPVRAGTSHAVFVRMDGPVAVLRYFTSAGELPACGHGTVAAIALLARGADRREFALRAGGRTFFGRAVVAGDRIEATFDPGPVTVRAATATEMGPVFAALGAAAGPGAAAVPGFGAAAVAVPGDPGTGRPRMLVPVVDRAALAALAPDFDRLRAACDRFGLLGCYVYSAPEPGGRLAARMFAPSIGVPEDIANANSTACLAAHLGTDIRADMGDALGEPATVTATAHPLLVGGAAVVMTG